MSKIITVTGEKDPAEFQMILSHEHLLIDLRNQASERAPDRKMDAGDRSLLLRDPYALRDNLLLDSVKTAEEECGMLLQAGCNAIVDCSTPEIGRNPEKLRRLSQSANISIVMGCGYYTEDTHTRFFEETPEEKLAELLEAEIFCGIGGVRPGIIGEIGTSREILPGEKKALRIAARVQRTCGLAIQVHIYPWSVNGLEALKILEKFGVPPEKIVICHSDVAPDRNYILALLQEGVYVQFDNFGKEFTPDSGGFTAGGFVRDTERAELAARIVQDGFGDKLLITNDICLKCMLSAFGGSGYCHIFNHILPMIAGHGIPMEYLKNHIMHDNPVTMLAV